MRIGNICKECGNDDEMQARFVVQVREITKQRDIALAKAQLELVNLEDKLRRYEELYRERHGKSS